MSLSKIETQGQRGKFKNESFYECQSTNILNSFPTACTCKLIDRIQRLFHQKISLETFKLS